MNEPTRPPAPMPPPPPTPTPPAKQESIWPGTLGLIGFGMVLLALDPLVGGVLGIRTQAFTNMAFIVFALATCFVSFKLRLVTRFIVAGLMAVSVAFFVSRFFLGDVFYDALLQVLNSHTDPTQRLFFADFEKLDPALNPCHYCLNNSGQGAKVLEDLGALIFLGGVFLTVVGTVFRMLGWTSAPAPASAAPQPSGRSSGIGRLDRIDRRGFLLAVVGLLLSLVSGGVFGLEAVVEGSMEIGAIELEDLQAWYVHWPIVALFVGASIGALSAVALSLCGAALLIYGGPDSRRRNVIRNVIRFILLWGRIIFPVFLGTGLLIANLATTCLFFLPSTVRGRVHNLVAGLIHYLAVESVAVGVFMHIFYLILFSILIYAVGPIAVAVTGEFTLLESFERYQDHPGWLKMTLDILNLREWFIWSGIVIWVIGSPIPRVMLGWFFGSWFGSSGGSSGGGSSGSSSSSGSTPPPQAHAGMLNAIRNAARGR